MGLMFNEKKEFMSNMSILRKLSRALNVGELLYGWGWSDLSRFD